MGPIDVTSNIPEYTVDYLEDGIPIDSTLNVPILPITTSNNLDDYKYLIHTIHTDDDDHQLYKIKIIDMIT